MNSKVALESAKVRRKSVIRQGLEVVRVSVLMKASHELLLLIFLGTQRMLVNSMLMQEM